MKVLHVTSGIDPKSGGPTRSVKGICRALARDGIDVTLLVLHGHHEFDNSCGTKVVYGSLPDVRGFDLIHLQGLWDPALHKVALACRRAKIPYVMSPRGMLDPWALSVKKWKKRLAMFLYQRNDLKCARAFHVTAALEEESVRQAGFKQFCIIAPNGVDIPDERMFECSEYSNVLAGEGRTAIFLSRLHPGKGLLLLAEAWARVNPKGWTMRIVGPDPYGHKAEVLAKLDALGITHADVPARTQSNNRTIEHHSSDFASQSDLRSVDISNNSSWQFVDMVDDVRKWQEYATAELLVHPSISENFGITIAEGLAAGLPVICTDGTPWAEIAERKCGWYIKADSVDALAIALREATNSTELAEMGARGRKLVEDHYTWLAVCDKMVRGYEEVLK